MEENVYKQARLTAARKDPTLSTVERTYQRLYMSRERLLMIEQSDPHKRRTTPAPEEVLQMACLYQAPELLDHYCTHHCPIRKGDTPLLHDSLGQIAASLMAALHFLEQANDDIHSILRDSKVSENERAEFLKIMQPLKDIAFSVASLDLWAQKNGLSPSDTTAGDGR